MNGIVKRYNSRHGFGFIAPLIGKPDTTPEVFFHATAVRGGAAIPAGAEVQFDLVRGEKGPQAANVELVRVTTRALSGGSRAAERRSEHLSGSR